MDRYSNIAEGLLFIIKFESLPCFKKRKRADLKCIVHLLQQLHRGQPAEAHCGAAVGHHIFFFFFFMCKDLYHNLLSLRS